MRTYSVVSIIYFLLSVFTLQAQVSVVSSGFQPFRVSPSSLLQVNVVNSGESTQAYASATLSNASGQVLLRVDSHPFELKPGFNSFQTLQLRVLSTVYGSDGQSRYVQSNGVLPSGYYRYCVTLVPSGNGEWGDEYCQETESASSLFMALMYPFDGDTVDTPYPVLSWTHTEPFSVLAQGEQFRLVVVRLSEGQSAEAGIHTNLPLYVKHFVNTHQVQYPFDGMKLERGVRYGWQVQKLYNGVMVQSTEAWEFVLEKEREVKPLKYVLLERERGKGYHSCADGRLYFRFDEDYHSSELSYRLTDEKQQEVSVPASRESGQGIKRSGVNLYELDLRSYGLSAGYYELRVSNARKQHYYLRFYYEK